MVQGEKAIRPPGNAKPAPLTLTFCDLECPSLVSRLPASAGVATERLTRGLHSTGPLRGALDFGLRLGIFSLLLRPGEERGAVQRFSLV